MPIYDKPTRLLMRQMVKDMPIVPGQVVSRKNVVDWFTLRYPKIKEGTVTAHLLRLSTNAPSRIYYSPRAGEDDLFFQLDSGRFRLYDPASDPPPTVGTAKTITSTPASESGEEEESGGTTFAYESDLRNFLSKNLSILEPGLKLYEEEGITGVEFPAGGRFIDILVSDSKGAYTVIELKVSRGYDRTVGQLRRYMGWIAENQTDAGQAVHLCQVPIDHFQLRFSLKAHDDRIIALAILRQRRCQLRKTLQAGQLVEYKPDALLAWLWLVQKPKD